MAGGKPEYTEAIAEEMCDWIANGGSLRAYCAQDGKPGYSTVFAWLKEREELQEAYARAREVQAHNDADQIADVRTMALRGVVEADVARVAIDSLKWTAARRLPKVYGDKLALSGDEANAPIVVTWGNGQKV